MVRFGAGQYSTYGRFPQKQIPHQRGTTPAGTSSRFLTRLLIRVVDVHVSERVRARGKDRSKEEEGEIVRGLGPLAWIRETMENK